MVLSMWTLSVFLIKYLRLTAVCTPFGVFDFEVMIFVLSSTWIKLSLLLKIYT